MFKIFLKWVILSIAIVIIISLIFKTIFPKIPLKKYSGTIERYSKANLNIRSGPSINNKILKTISPNDKVVTCDSIIDGFIMVLNSDSTYYGWTSINYLQKNPLQKEQIAELEKENLNEPVITSSINAGLLKYSIIKTERVGLPSQNRAVCRILASVDDLPTDEQMKKTATYIWQNGNHDWNEFTVFIYLPEMDLQGSAYGICEFSSQGLTDYFKTTSNLYGTKWE